VLHQHREVLQALAQRRVLGEDVREAKWHPLASLDRCGDDGYNHGMPIVVPIREAKAQLSRLLLRVEVGEEIAIARGGKVVARLVPEHRTPPRVLRTWASRIHVLPDFDAPLPDDCFEALEP
jgi:prevent-host-death family protein